MSVVVTKMLGFRVKLLSLLSIGLFACGAQAQSMRPAVEGADIKSDPGQPPANFKDVGIDQKLGAQIPGELVFRDETGREIQLKDYFKLNRPILFTLVYYGCPRLCTTVLTEQTKALTPMPLTPGKDFEIVVVSFDPREGPDLAAKKKDEYTRFYRRPGSEVGWHFLTGDASNIKALTDAVGFHYSWDEQHQQFIHAGGLIVLTPDGRASKYFYGVDYVPRDLRLALLEAGDNKIGSLTDKILLYCFEYDPHTGRYSIAILSIVRVLGVMTVLAIGLFVVRNVRRGRPATSAGPDESLVGQERTLGGSSRVTGKGDVAGESNLGDPRESGRHGGQNV